MQGEDYISQCFLRMNLKTIFGIIGHPVINLGLFMHANGANFIACRNEQTASYGAASFGFLNQTPGICLTVSGPGMVHALAGMTNAMVNKWPLIVISGAVERHWQGLGGFQEYDQIGIAKTGCKWAVVVNDLQFLPYILNRAKLTSLSVPQGAVYIELPADVIRSQVKDAENSLKLAESLATSRIPLIIPDPEACESLLNKFLQAKSPLIIVGKGAQSQLSSKELSKLVTFLEVPFLPSPLGKGVLPDINPFNSSSARSTCLQQADCILLLGARLN